MFDTTLTTRGSHSKKVQKTILIPLQYISIALLFHTLHDIYKKPFLIEIKEENITIDSFK